MDVRTRGMTSLHEAMAVAAEQLRDYTHAYPDCIRSVHPFHNIVNRCSVMVYTKFSKLFVCTRESTYRYCAVSKCMCLQCSTINWRHTIIILHLPNGWLCDASAILTIKQSFILSNMHSSGKA